MLNYIECIQLILPLTVCCINPNEIITYSYVLMNIGNFIKNKFVFSFLLDRFGAFMCRYRTTENDMNGFSMSVYSCCRCHWRTILVYTNIEIGETVAHMGILIIIPISG